VATLMEDTETSSAKRAVTGREVTPRDDEHPRPRRERTLMEETTGQNAVDEAQSAKRAQRQRASEPGDAPPAPKPTVKKPSFITDDPPKPPRRDTPGRDR